VSGGDDGERRGTVSRRLSFLQQESAMNRVAWSSVILAAVLVLTAAGPAWAQIRVSGGGYNPYTGNRYYGAGSYNPYTGRGAYAGGGYNPYTGTVGRAGGAYNSYTGRVAGGASAYNPYTGAYGAVRYRGRR
jgi:hypothetical protein